MKRPTDASLLKINPKKRSLVKKMQKVVFFPKEVQKVFPSVTPPWAEAVKVKFFHSIFTKVKCVKFQNQLPEKVLIFVVKTITKMRTFSGHWVWNWYAINALYFMLKVDITTESFCNYAYLQPLCWNK